MQVWIRIRGNENELEMKICRNKEMPEYTVARIRGCRFARMPDCGKAGMQEFVVLDMCNEMF